MCHFVVCIVIKSYFSEFNGDNKYWRHIKMKKINPRIVTVVMVMLSILIAGGFAAKEVICPSGGGATGGFEEEIDPPGG